MEGSGNLTCELEAIAVDGSQAVSLDVSAEESETYTVEVTASGTNTNADAASVSVVFVDEMEEGGGDTSGESTGGSTSGGTTSGGRDGGSTSAGETSDGGDSDGGGESDGVSGEDGGSGRRYVGRQVRHIVERRRRERRARCPDAAAVRRGASPAWSARVSMLTTRRLTTPERAERRLLRARR